MKGESDMKTNKFNRYSFAELLAAATAAGAGQSDIDTLGAWFGEYGGVYFNGEYYDASAPGEPSGTRRLFPVYAEADDGEIEVIGYEFR